MNILESKRADGTKSRAQRWNKFWLFVAGFCSLLAPFVYELREAMGGLFSAYPWAVPLLIVAIKMVDAYHRSTTTQPLDRSRYDYRDEWDGRG